MTSDDAHSTAPPTPPEGDELDVQVDRLLDDVESLTTEILTDRRQGRAAHRDPRRAATDDAVHEGDSPLIVDGEPTAIEDVVSDVELELDRARERLRALANDGSETSPEPVIEDEFAELDHPPTRGTSSAPPRTEPPAPAGVPKEMVGSSPASDAAAGAIGTSPTSEHPNADAPSTAPGKKDGSAKPTSVTTGQAGGAPPATRPGIPEKAPIGPTPASATPAPTDDQVLREMEQLLSDAEALGTAAAKEPVPPPRDPVHTAAAPAAPAQPAAPQTSVDQELDMLKDLLDEMADQTTASDAPGEPRSAPSPAAKPPSPSSRQERALDADLDALLGPKKAAAPKAPVTARAEPSGEALSAAESDTEPEPAKIATARPPLSAEDLAEISVWFLLRARLGRIVGGVRARMASAGGSLIARLLEIIDRPFRRLSASTREMIGYCALGTLAMCLIAVLAAWVAF